ncbi:MAG: OsmC family peroxiredoxin, partial [Gemmatimonadota bacterium]
MPVRVASAEWKGNLPKGSGTLETETGAVKGSYSFASRFEEGAGTNPEELIAAAHAGCFSMAFANGLAKAGFEPTSIRTTAKVFLEKGPDGFGVSRIELECVGNVPG